MPQLTAALLSVGRMNSRVATAMLHGASMFSSWWKSGSATGGAARSASFTKAARRAVASSSRTWSRLSNTRT